MFAYHKFIKPVLDFLFSTLALVVLSPILILTTVLLFFQNKGTPFFLQERPGKDGMAFYILKFKTMTDERDAKGVLLPDVLRVTKFGKIIRNLSIDELPQLINILKGEMSIVGPRPLLFKYIPLYTQEQMRRHNVKPGITGWAQINGRNSISWGKKFEFDVYYVDHISFGLDLRIIVMTLFKVIKREGVNQTIQRPMEPFNGYN